MSIRRELEARAQKAILDNIIENYKKQRSDWKNDPDIRKKLLSQSFFKPANALLIAGSILSAGCLPLIVLPLLVVSAPVWMTLGAAVAPLVAGGIAEAIFLWRSINDEEAHTQAVAEMLEPEINFDRQAISDEELQAKVDKALEYWALIDDAIESTPEGTLQERMENTVREVTHWLQAVYNLASRVDKFTLNKIIKRDLQSVPQAISQYKRKLDREDSPEVRRQLEKTIADKERQLRTLQNLQDNMEKANYQLDSTISSLGTIYSQLLLVGSKDESGGRINRLQEEISEQIYRLEDLTDAMDEVYESSY